eukprot:CAMPEP_0172740940 /NCGR_PEP_ID=MMETSP1074-20121228/125975_1 /TAXON_ID=2916 /ORGANISM="Ceratium fusus, Strain PA161109" /LENGTH=51 /DNA_ID=CAMNT_0013571165 /DNA_START=82 /DNA_END=237 /DNA_ORIENTATION=-
MKFTTRGVELNGSCMVEDATPVTPYRSPPKMVADPTSPETGSTTASSCQTA